MDGETEVSLGDAAAVNPGQAAAFDGNLETPTRAVIVSTSEAETVLRMTVTSPVTRVRIWVNRPVEPDNVIVGLG